MTDVLERLRAANPVPSSSYAPEDVAAHVGAILTAPRPNRGPVLAAAAVVVATAGVATTAALVSWPSDRTSAGGSASPEPQVTVQCRAGTGELSGARFDRATDVVEDRLQSADVKWLGLDTQPSSGFIDVTVPEHQVATATAACHPTTVAVRSGRTVLVGAPGVVTATIVPPNGGRREYGVRVTFTPAAAEVLRRHAHERLSLVVGTATAFALPAPDSSHSVILTGNLTMITAERLADDIVGAAATLRPVP